MADVLSHEMKDLLARAKNAGGVIWVASYDEWGRFVLIGTYEFDGNPETRRRYLEALCALQNSGDVEQETGTKYALTSQGWEAARFLQSTDD